MPNVKLKLENVHKDFGNVRAVNDFTHNIIEGECVVLLGPSGCGKTTLLRLIGGFLRPDQGSIYMDEKEVSSPLRCAPPDKRNMSMVFQSYALWPNRTVFENVAYGLKLRKLPSAKIKAMVYEVLSLVRMNGLEKRYPTELSGGQQQRVALARALVVKPDVLLLDEPLSNLDAKLRVQMRDDIREIHSKSKITFIYVTHDQAEAMVMADCIILMNEGKIVQVGTPEELYMRPKSNFVANFIGVSNQIAGYFKSYNEEKDVISLETEFGEIFYSSDKNSFTGDNSQARKRFICIRPEAIHLANNQSSNISNQFEGRINKRKYYGHMIEYEVKTEHRSVIVQTPPTEKFAIGQIIFLHIEPRDCIIVEG